MHHSAEPDFLGQLDTIFAQLNPQDVEQFYSAYKQWLLQQQIASLQRRILHVQQQLADNTQSIQQTQPSPIALATLARLQSNGVNDIDLLDSMLTRGEAWLDATMQRLDYCEQIDDFISDNYTQWCRLALEGAFDWIDSIGDEASPPSSGTEEAPPMAADIVNANTEATEALLLQKLTSESDEQEDLSWQEETLKQAVIKLASQVEDSAISEEETPSFVEFASVEEPTMDIMDADANISEQSTLVEVPVPEEVVTPEEPSTSEYNAPDLSELTEQSTRVEVAAPEEVVIAEETGSPEPVPSEYVEVGEPEQFEESRPGSLEHGPAPQPEIADNPETAINHVDASYRAPTKLPKRSILQRLIAKLLGE